MAIVVQEERNKRNFLGLIGWAAVLVGIVAAIYYIFFAAPELIVIPATGNLGAIEPIAQIQLNPEDVLNSASFQALHSTIAVPTATSTQVGRPNPFLAP